MCIRDSLRAIQELAIEQQGKHRRDEYMQGELRIPLQQEQKSTGG